MITEIFCWYQTTDALRPDGLCSWDCEFSGWVFLIWYIAFQRIIFRIVHLIRVLHEFRIHWKRKLLFRWTSTLKFAMWIHGQTLTAITISPGCHSSWIMLITLLPREIPPNFSTRTSCQEEGRFSFIRLIPNYICEHVRPKSFRLKLCAVSWPEFVFNMTSTLKVNLIKCRTFQPE